MEILNNPLDKTGLSGETIKFFKKLGYTTIQSIIVSETPSYEELHKRIVGLSHEEEKSIAQHAYNELLEYIKYYGVKCKEEKEPQKTITR